MLSKAVLAFFIVLGITLLMFSAALSQDVPTFTIGVIDDPLGAVANGARLAVEEINNSGGVTGVDGVSYRLALAIEPLTFQAGIDGAVENLRAAGVVAVLGPAANEVMLNGLEALQSLNVPILTPATDDTLLTSDTSGRIFRTRPAEAVLGRALARYIIEDFGLTEIITVQLDVASTASVIGFQAAASSLGAPTGSALLRDPADLTALTDELINVDPDVLAVFGSPALAGSLYINLRDGGWQGLFAYNQPNDPNFRGFIPLEQLEGILSATSWSYTGVDQASVDFLNAYIRTLGALPGPIEVAAFDSINLIAFALESPGELRDNIAATTNFPGVQGILDPFGLSGGETNRNTVVTRLGEFGAPEVRARFNGDVRLPPDQPLVISPDSTDTPAPTPTIDGVVITVLNQRQNVRSGPGLNYDILGQLNEGEQARVIGATADNTWVVIDYRGLQGWLATYLLEVVGNLDTVPIINPPPTPTIGVTPTPTRAPEADIVIDGAVMIPSPVIPGATFNVTVTVRNAGASPAGAFTVAGTFPPNNIVAQTVVPGLAPSQSLLISLTGTLTNTGAYATTLIADANNQVIEGAVGETNNAFVLSYSIDRTPRRQSSATLNLGDTIDLEGDAVQGDANWNSDGGVGLDVLGGAKIAILPGTDINAIHYDLINPAAITRDNIPRTELNLGMLIGIITADGNRGVMRVDAISDSIVTFAFKLY